MEEERVMDTDLDTDTDTEREGEGEMPVEVLGERETEVLGERETDIELGDMDADGEILRLVEAEGEADKDGD